MSALAVVLTGALIPILTAHSLGRLATRRAPFSGVEGQAVGWALLSQVYLIALLAGVAGPWLFVAIAALAVAAGGVGRPRFAPAWIWLAAAPYVLWYAVHALAPESTPDGITYHLGLVRDWLRTGGIGERIGHFEIMPHGVEVLFAGAYSVGGHSSAKLVSFALLLLTVALVRSVARKLGVPEWPAALLFLFAPVVGIAGTSSYVDTALACFAVATLGLLLDGRNGWAAFTAGFCYAVKMTGGTIAAATALYLLLRRDWRSAALCAVAPLPWIARAWWLTGNPFAPLFNAWFPSEHFHVSTERSLAEFVANYGVATGDLWRELTLVGDRTAGLLGPGFLAVPLALLALRRREGRWLWTAAVAAGLPWIWNHGTRFLIPAAPFAALALACALPRAAMWIVVALQAVLCFPPVLETWCHPKAWRLVGFPWQVALRIEDETAWLRREVTQYPVAEMISRKAGAGARVLDLATIATAYTDAAVFTHWQYANAERAADSLHMATTVQPGRFFRMTAALPGAVAGVRVEQTGRAASGWSLAELTVWNGEAKVFPSQSWELDASPNPWIAALAFDRTPVSRWQTWGPAVPGQFVEARFPQPVKADRLELLRAAYENGTEVRAKILVGSEWKEVALLRRDWIPMNLRRRAIAYVRREGFSHIAVHTAQDGWGPVGTDLVMHWRDWGVERVADQGGVYLLRLP